MTDEINESTELTIDGSLDNIGGSVPVDAEIKIIFNTDEYRFDSSIRGDFKFFTSSSALKSITTTSPEATYPTPASLEVKEVGSDGSYITLRYTASTAVQFNIKISGFNTPSYPSETGRLQLYYTDTKYRELPSRRITFVF